MTKRIYGNLAALNSAIETFAKADQSHYSKMKEIIAGCILHAADHGDCGPMTKFYNSVSAATQGVMKRAIRKINAEYGKNHVIGGGAFQLFSGENKNKQITFFFTKEHKVEGKVIIPETEEGRIKEVRTAIREAMKKDNEEIIARFIDAEIQRDTDAIRVFDGSAKLLALIKSAAAVHGYDKSTLVALNRLIPDENRRFQTSAIDDMWKKGAEPGTVTDKDREEFARLKAKMEAAEKKEAEAKAEQKEVKPAKAA